MSLNGIDQSQLKLVTNLLKGFGLYTTLFVLVALAIAFLVVRLTAKEKTADFLKVAIGISVGYSVTIASTFLFLELSRSHLKGEIISSFYWALGLLGVSLLLVAIGIIVNKRFANVAKIYNLCAVLTVGVLSVLLLVLVKNSDDYYAPSNKALMYVLSFLLIAVILIITFLFGKDQTSEGGTKSITYAGVCIALSYALSYTKIFDLPHGGSVTLASLLPLMIYSYKFGVKKGLATGCIYGFLQFLQDPIIYQPMQFFLDYPIAFGGIGLAGIFSQSKIFKDKDWLKFLLGGIIAGTLRYFSHVLSGIFVFGSYGADFGFGAVAWGFIYNTFVFADVAIVLIIGTILTFNKSVLKIIKQ